MARRIGTKDSATRAQLLDAAEQLMVDEGYAAVTSRGLAAAAGLKPQLVHYYFRTMDDLFVELFQRQAEENIVRFEEAIADGVSLQQLWRMNNNARAATRTIEFVALANHRKAIRTEIARYAERFRAAQLDAITKALATATVDVPPMVVLLLMEGLAQVLGLEQMIDVTSGHDETVAFVERTLASLDGQAVTPATRSARRRLGSRRR